MAMMDASRLFVFLAKLALQQQRIMPIIILILAQCFARRLSAAFGTIGLLVDRVIGIAIMRPRIRFSITACVFLTTFKNKIYVKENYNEKYVFIQK